MQGYSNARFSAFLDMKILSNSVADTLRTARALAGNLGKGDIVALFGELGSGKTVFAKGIARGLGIRASDIISPTFVLIREYKGVIPFYHFDLYRVNGPEDIMDLGYEEYLYGEGLTVIEWAERLGYLLPAEVISVKLSIRGKKQRLFDFKAGNKRYKKIIEKLNENIRH